MAGASRRPCSFPAWTIAPQPNVKEKVSTPRSLELPSTSAQVLVGERPRPAAIAESSVRTRHTRLPRAGRAGCVPLRRPNRALASTDCRTHARFSGAAPATPQHVEPPGGESERCRSQECAAIVTIVREHVQSCSLEGIAVRRNLSSGPGDSIGLWYCQPRSAVQTSAALPGTNTKVSWSTVALLAYRHQALPAHATMTRNAL